MPINYEAAKTLIKGLVQKMKSFRGNWNQNDPTADDYIRNRPFYTEQAEIVILPKTTINGEQSVKIKTPLIVGQEYKITWNGVIYRSIAREYDGYRMIGNNAVYEYDNGIKTNTGEPFAAETEGDNLNLYFYMDDTVTEPPTVSITIFGEKVHKINEKYLPDMHYLSYKKRQNLTYEQQKTALRNVDDALYDGVSNIVSDNSPVKYVAQTLTNSQKQQARTNIGAAATTDITNATTGMLKYTAQTLTDDQKEVARANIGLSDAIRYSEQTLTDEQKAQVCNNLDVYSKQDVHTLQSSFLSVDSDSPSYIRGNITSIIYGDNIFTNTYGIDEKESLTINGITYQFVGTYEPTTYFSIGFPMKFLYGYYETVFNSRQFFTYPTEVAITDALNVDGTSYYLSQKVTLDFLSTSKRYKGDFIFLFCINTKKVYVNIQDSSGIAFSGIYELRPYKQTIVSNDRISTIIPRASTASPGQTIVVKAVDDAGKPTEWEAQALPEGVPAYTSDDEGKFLRIVNGVPTWVAVPNAEEASF